MAARPALTKSFPKLLTPGEEKLGEEKRPRLGPRPLFSKLSTAVPSADILEFPVTGRI